MKTALQLLGFVPPRAGWGDSAFTGWCVTSTDLEVIAQRAREETREAAAQAAMTAYQSYGTPESVWSAIQTLPVEWKP